MEEDAVFRECLARCKRQDEEERLLQEWKLLKQTNTLSILCRFIQLMPLLGDEHPWFVRGSAGCSMVVYLMGGSLFHPIDYGLSLERFTNIHRKTIGDIDIDVSPDRRPDIFKNIQAAFPEKVGRVSSRVFYRKKSAEKCYKGKKPSHAVVGTFRHYSLHVGGLCFWEEPIPQKYILRSCPTQPLPQLRLDKNDIQEQKMHKIDVLNNHAIKVILDIDPLFSWKTFSKKHWTDPKVWALIQQGDTMGVLYGESPMMKRCLALIRPSSMLELALCFSLIRPMNRRVRFRLEKNPSYADHIKTMKEPYFDDDWIRWLARTRGLSLADADALRRRMARDPTESKLKGYGFCRSHALHYAFLIYVQAYYKVYFPAMFYCAILNQKKGMRMYDKWVYVIDAFLHGIFVRDIPVNTKSRFVVSKKGDLIPEGGVQRRLFPLSVSQQFVQYGLFSTNDKTKLDFFSGKIACSRRLSTEITACHVFDSSLNQFINVLS